MITTRKLWIYLHCRGIQISKLRTDKIVSGQTYSNLREDKSITINTVNSICEYLHCQPGDILEWIPDDEINKQVKGDSNEQ